MESLYGQYMSIMVTKVYKYLINKKLRNAFLLDVDQILSKNKLSVLLFVAVDTRPNRPNIGPRWILPTCSIKV